MAAPPTFSFCAPSNSGKTTFLCELIKILKAANYKIGVGKSCHHPLKDDDTESDTRRFREAGADIVTTIVIKSDWPKIKESMKEMDIILVEGGRKLGEKIILFAGWKQDTEWFKPKAAEWDLSDINDPLHETVRLLIQAIKQYTAPRK